MTSAIDKESTFETTLFPLEVAEHYKKKEAEIKLRYSEESAKLTDRFMQGDLSIDELDRLVRTSGALERRELHALRSECMGPWKQVSR